MDLSQINDVIKVAQNIVVAGHVNGDGDSIGACLAMAFCLEKIGKSPTVYLGNIAEKYSILPGFNFVHKGNISDIPTPDLFISLDCGEDSRLGEDILPLFKKTKSIVIDHHVNLGFGDYNYIVPTASSTCEILYDIIVSLCEMDRNIAQCLYAGLVTDTGGFRLSNTNTKTFEVASHLVKEDIPFSQICEKLMYELTLKQFNGFISIVSKFVYVSDINLVYVIATKEEMDKLQITRTDLDGVSNMLRRISELEISIFAYETDNNKVKISLRSRSININKVAKALGGGGHINASGVVLDMPVNEAVEKVINKIRELGDVI